MAFVYSYWEALKLGQPIQQISLCNVVKSLMEGSRSKRMWIFVCFILVLSLHCCLPSFVSMFIAACWSFLPVLSFLGWTSIGIIITFIIILFVSVYCDIWNFLVTVCLKLFCFEKFALHIQIASFSCDLASWLRNGMNVLNLMLTNRPLFCNFHFYWLCWAIILRNNTI